MHKIIVSGIGGLHGSVYESETHLLNHMNSLVKLYEIRDQDEQRVLWHKGWDRPIALITVLNHD